MLLWAECLWIKNVHARRCTDTSPKLSEHFGPPLNTTDQNLELCMKTLFLKKAFMISILFLLSISSFNHVSPLTIFLTLSFLTLSYTLLKGQFRSSEVGFCEKCPMCFAARCQNDWVSVNWKWT